MKFSITKIFLENSKVHQQPVHVKMTNKYIYVAEIRNLESQAFPDYNILQQEAETYRRFVKGVSHFLRAKIYEHNSLRI